MKVKVIFPISNKKPSQGSTRVDPTTPFQNAIVREKGFFFLRNDVRLILNNVQRIRPSGASDISEINAIEYTGCPDPHQQSYETFSAARQSAWKTKIQFPTLFFLFTLSPPGRLCFQCVFRQARAAPFGWVAPLPSHIRLRENFKLTITRVCSNFLSFIKRNSVTSRDTKL